MKKVQESGRWGERVLFLVLCRKFSHLAKLKQALCDPFVPMSLAIVLKYFRLVRLKAVLPVLLLFFTFHFSLFTAMAQEVVVLSPLKTNNFGACTDGLDSREVQLCIDKVPGVSVSLPRYVCEGGKAELRVALDGGDPFLLEYDVTRYSWGKYPTLLPMRRNIVMARR